MFEQNNEGDLVPYFHNDLKNIFNNSSENREYLLITIDKINVYWMIKIPFNSFTQDFITLLKYILPLNVHINGFLFVGDYKKQEIDNKVIIYNESLKGLDINLDEKIYVFSLNNINDLTEEDSKGYQEIFLKRSNLHVKY